MAAVKQVIGNGIDENELRIVLIGKSGVGKSSTANTILGSQAFKAEASSISVTEKCDFERSERFGKRILLVDTPGFFDTSTDKDAISNEMKKCMGISAPGPHAILLVMSFTKRFTEEERKVLTEVSDMFGDQMIKYLIVMFTGRDQMDEGFLIENHVEEYPEEFRRIVNNAGGGYITVNNRGSDSEKEDDVEKLLNRIDQMVKRNGGGHFTSEMFEAAEEVIQQEIANLAEKEEKMKDEKKKRLLQIKQADGSERAEVREQLAGAGREIQQLLAKRKAAANDSAERHLATLRDEERKNIQKEKGSLQGIKQAMEGIESSFLNLFG